MKKFKCKLNGVLTILPINENLIKVVLLIVGVLTATLLAVLYKNYVTDILFELKTVKLMIYVTVDSLPN